MYGNGGGMGYGNSMQMGGYGGGRGGGRGYGGGGGGRGYGGPQSGRGGMMPDNGGYGGGYGGGNFRCGTVNLICDTRNRIYLFIVPLLILVVAEAMLATEDASPRATAVLPVVQAVTVGATTAAWRGPVVLARAMVTTTPQP